MILPKPVLRPFAAVPDPRAVPDHAHAAVPCFALLPVLACVFAGVLGLAFPASGILRAQDVPEMGSAVFGYGLYEDDPPWVLLERGKRAMRPDGWSSGEYGEALYLFRLAARKGEPFPEAEKLIGDVFAKTGNFTLAEKQYLKAWEMRDHLAVSAERYGILYDLAAVYRNSNQHRKHQEKLEKIVLSDPDFAREDLPERLIGVLTEQDPHRAGLDKLLELYRLEPDHAHLAQRELGYLYCRSGRHGRAARNLAFSAVKTLTRVIDEIMMHDPAYEYRTIADLFRRTERHDEITSFLETNDMYRNLYYLAYALYFTGSREAGRAVWRTVAVLPGAGLWAHRAEDQLHDPLQESLIVPQR